MSLSGNVQAAPPGALGFDSDTTITADVARQFFNDDYRFCVRYLSRATSESSADLTAQEAADILGAGLALMPVQHVRAAGWVPSGAVGTQDGTNAAAHATAIGFPAGVNVWCDLEGVSQSGTLQDVLDYCKAWHVAVAQGGFAPGLYVGAAALLNGQQLFSDLPFQHYWKSESTVPDVARRGYQMVQTLETKRINGIGIDRDVTQTDALGGQVQWLAPAGSQAQPASS